MINGHFTKGLPHYVQNRIISIFYDFPGDTEESPKWFASVLLLNNKTLVVDNDIISPQEYLTKAKYVDVIERDVGTPRQTIR